MFLAAVGCRGLKSFAVGGSVVPSGFITDALLRASVANNVLQPSLFGIGIEMPVGPSDDAILDFCFSPYTAPGGQCRSLMIEYSGITDLFLTKFFKRLQSGDVRPAGNLKFFGGPPKQRGLSAYAQHLAPGRTDGTDVRYRFPPVDDDSKHYEVVLYESYFTDVSFGKRSYFDDIDEQDEYKSFRDRKVKEEEDEEAQEWIRRRRTRSPNGLKEAGEAGPRQNARRRFQ
ncbi:hypothetical protein AAVH_29924 [Aphelenchoides avenae]|nr:hypothetical protein AAVH_29924 [Aphelenchus avenae]